MTAAESRPISHLYLALIAAGAIVGALTAAGSCAIEWTRGRRT